jgi:hypothetical protein
MLTPDPNAAVTIGTPVKVLHEKCALAFSITEGDFKIGNVPKNA